MPLQHALYPEHADTSVVCGKVTDLLGPLRLASDLILVDEIRVAIASVVLDRDWPSTENDVVLASRHLRWPIEMVDPKEGQNVLLLVGRNLAAAGDYYVETLLPWTGRNLVVATSESEAMGVIERDLLGSLRDTTEVERQVALLRTIAPVLGAEEAPEIEDLLEHSDGRVRRAALGATMYGAPTEGTAGKIGADVTRFFDSLAGSECSRTAAGCSSLISDELFASYPFLNPRARRWGSRWDEEEAGFYTGLARMVAPHLQLSQADMAIIFPADPGSPPNKRLHADATRSFARSASSCWAQSPSPHGAVVSRCRR
jgi:hypothetical protein